MSRWLSPASRVGTRRMTLRAHSSQPCQSPATTIRRGPADAVDASPDDSDSDSDDSDSGDPALGVQAAGCSGHD